MKEDSGFYQVPYLETPMIQSTNNRIEYKYYRDINKLVKRLQLLSASQSTGNTSVGVINKLYEIMEELEKYGYELRTLIFSLWRLPVIITL